MVCQEDWEQRHPQDLLRVQREQISVPWSRPYPAQDTYIPETLWTKPEDALGLNETNAMDVHKYFPENVGAGIVSAGFNSFSFNAHELDYNDPYVPPTVAGETVNITETVLAVLARFIDESVSITELISNGLGRPLSETVPIGESQYYAETETSSDSLSLAESSLFDVSKALDESLTISESIASLIVSPTSLDGAAFNTLSLG